MSKGYSVCLHKEYFPTWGNEVCVEVIVHMGAKVHCLEVEHSNVDGDYEVMMTKRFKTGTGLVNALEAAECADFSLNYNFEKMLKAAEKLPEIYQEAIRELCRYREIPLPKRLMTAKESKEKYGNTIFVSSRIVQRPE